MDTSKVVAHAILGGSTSEAQAAKVAGFAILGSSADEVQATKVVAFAVLGDAEPINYPDVDTDTIELFTFSVQGTGLVWRYTTHTAPHDALSASWTPEAIARSAVSRTINNPSGDLTIEVGDENAFALRLFDGLTSRPVDVLVQQWQWGALSAETVFTGRTSGVSFDGPKATINCVPRYSVASRRKVPWQTFQAGCNWQLFSEGCTLDRESFVLGPYALATSAWSGATVTITGTHTDGDLSNGWIERVADGDRRFIEQNVGAALTLQSAFPTVVDGEQWKVYPGCRRTEEDCAGRYNNLPHYLGWSRLPAVNPFSRGAFYLQAATPPAPPAGTIADLGGGYTLVLADYPATLTVTGSYSGYVGTSVGIRFTLDGYAGITPSASSGILSPFTSRFISPRPCPPTVTADLEVFISSTGVAVGSLGDRISVAAGSGFDAWVPLTATHQAVVSVGTQGNGSGGNSGLVGATTQVHVRVRRASTGLVLAEGDLTMNFRATVGKPSGAA